jgi:diguanylate cyclase (GGDEF)-like protein
MSTQLTGSTTARIAQFPTPVPSQRSRAIPKSEALALANLGNLLHSQLSSSWVIDQFYRESHQVLGYTGLIYQYPGESTGLSHGVLGGNNCCYDLVLNGEHLGTLDFYCTQGFNESQLINLERYLRVLLYPLRNALLFYNAQQRAFRDALTGARNRASFDADLITEIELAHRHGHPLSLIVMDIDHFKQVNDSQGHAFGDEVLKTISDIAHGVIRTSDQFYRYGGEEFVIIAAHSALDGTRLLAERLRASIYDKNHRGVSGLTLSSSFGVAQLRADETGTELFERADKALYQAKRSGRNQVAV